MDVPEQQLFDQFEQELHTDLHTWRDTLLEYREDLLFAIYQDVKKDDGSDVSMTDEDDVRSVGEVLREKVLDNYKNIENGPLYGDTVTATGKMIYHVYNAETKAFDVELCHESAKLTGTVEGIDIQPYIDEACLYFEPEELSDVELEKYIRNFGIHLVLNDAYIIGADDIIEQLETERVYLPVHYSTTRLVASYTT